MLKFTQDQYDALELAHFRRVCLEFLERELRMLDCNVPIQQLQLRFDQLQSLVGSKHADNRQVLVLIMIAGFAFKHLFTPQVIEKFLSEPMAPALRRQHLQAALMRHASYDAGFLQRKTWLQ